MSELKLKPCWGCRCGGSFPIIFFFFNIVDNNMVMTPIFFFYTVQVSQCHQVISLLVIIKEQCPVNNEHFPTLVFHFHKLVIKIQIRLDKGNWQIFFMSRSSPLATQFVWNCWRSRFLFNMHMSFVYLSMFIDIRLIGRYCCTID